MLISAAAVGEIGSGAPRKTVSGQPLLASSSARRAPPAAGDWSCSRRPRQNSSHATAAAPSSAVLSARHAGEGRVSLAVPGLCDLHGEEPWWIRTADGGMSASRLALRVREINSRPRRLAVSPSRPRRFRAFQRRNGVPAVVHVAVRRRMKLRKPKRRTNGWCETGCLAVANVAAIRARAPVIRAVRRRSSPRR